MSETEQIIKKIINILSNGDLWYQHVQKNGTKGKKTKAKVTFKSDGKCNVNDWERIENWTEDNPTTKKIDYINIEQHDNELWLPLGNHVVNAKKFIQAYEEGSGVYTEKKYHCGPTGRKINTSGYFTFS